MNAPPTLTSEAPSLAPVPTPDRDRVLARLDESGRFPLLFLLVGAFSWLVLGSFALLISLVKLHVPVMMASIPWLTYGRIYPASLNAVLFGFASQAGLAVALWLLSRLGRTAIAWPGFVILAATFWNLGVLIGVVGILAGDTTGFQWLEMPQYATPILFFSYALIGVCALLTFAAREEKSLYVSQWYLLAALFWFPWIYSTAQLLLVFHPLRGVVQGAVHGWAVNGLFTLWLTPLGLAMIFYFIPKITERPLYSDSLAAFGFWTLAIFGAWGGLNPSMPLPAGIVSLSLASGVLMILPILSVAINWQQTLLGQTAKIKESLPLRFMAVAATSYVVAAVMSVAGSIHSISRITEFTFYNTAQNYLLLLGLIGMGVAGAAYYFVPRLAQAEFPCSVSIKVHWYGNIAGIALLTLGLLLAGLVQGFGLNDPDKSMLAVATSLKTWLQISALGLTFIVIANGAFLFNLVWLIVRKSRQCVADYVVPELEAAPAISVKRPEPAARPEPVLSAKPSAPTPTPQPKPRPGKKQKKR